MEKNMLANSSSKQDLYQHLVSIAFLSRHLVEGRVKSETLRKSLARKSFLAGITHDLGKTDASFQEALQSSRKKSSVDSYSGLGTKENDAAKKFVRHHELSLWLLRSNSTAVDEDVEYAVYRHHATRHEDTTTVSEYGAPYSNPKTVENVSVLYSKLNDVVKDQGLVLEVGTRDLPDSKNFIQPWKRGDFRTKLNSHRSLVRTALIEADRMVSALPMGDLEQCFSGVEFSLSHLLSRIG